MKLTKEQRKILDDTVLAIVRAAPHAYRFASIDTQTRILLVDELGGTWDFRLTDGALQRLRKSGLVRVQHQRWTATPRPLPPVPPDTSQRDESTSGEVVPFTPPPKGAA